MLEPFGYGFYNTREEFIEGLKKIDSCLLLEGKGMTDTLHEVAVNNAEKEYGLKDSMCMNIQESAYVKGFEAGVKYVYDRLREAQLMEVERTMDKVLNALIPWEPEEKDDRQ